MNQYLEKIASWTSNMRALKDAPRVMSENEIREIIKSKAMDVALLHTNRNDAHAQRELTKLLPEGRGRLSEQLILSSILKGPRYIPSGGKPGLKTPVILAGGVDHSTPILHELGHAIDLKDDINNTKTEIAVGAKVLEKTGIPLIVGGAMATSKKLRMAAPLIPWVVKAPTIKGEIDANIEAYNLIKEHKGEEAAKEYAKQSLRPLGTYLSTPAVSSAAIVALAVANAKAGKVKGLSSIIKKSSLEKWGKPGVITPRRKYIRKQTTPPKKLSIKYEKIVKNKQLIDESLRPYISELLRD